MATIPYIVVDGVRYETEADFDAACGAMPTPAETAPGGVGEGAPPSPTWARDEFVRSLISHGNNPDYARRVADQTAHTHDRRG